MRGQSRMDIPETMATLGTQVDDIKIKKHNTEN